MGVADLASPHRAASPRLSGTYPRPQCPSREPKPHNVRSHVVSRRSFHRRSTGPLTRAVCPGQRVLTTSFATRKSRVQIPPVPLNALVRALSASPQRSRFVPSCDPVCHRRATGSDVESTSLPARCSLLHTSHQVTWRGQETRIRGVLRSPDQSGLGDGEPRLRNKRTLPVTGRVIWVIWCREGAHYALSGREASQRNCLTLRDLRSDTFSDLDEVVRYWVSFLSVGS
jgi:hypothetical protein